jgi:hypothetical protein
MHFSGCTAGPAPGSSTGRGETNQPIRDFFAQRIASIQDYPDLSQYCSPEVKNLYHA